jgi:hypothetical protein
MKTRICVVVSFLAAVSATSAQAPSPEVMAKREGMANVRLAACQLGDDPTIRQMQKNFRDYLGMAYGMSPERAEALKNEGAQESEEAKKAHPDEWACSEHGRDCLLFALAQRDAAIAPRLGRNPEKLPDTWPKSAPETCDLTTPRATGEAAAEDQVHG